MLDHLFLLNFLDTKVFEKMLGLEGIKKLLLKAKKPSIGFDFLKDVNALTYLKPLKSLIGTPQDPIWHPEGDV